MFKVFKKHMQNEFSNTVSYNQLVDLMQGVLKQILV